MRAGGRALAAWHEHVNRCVAGPELRGWLGDRVSLTVKLIAHSETFRVQRLAQRRAVCLADESGAIGLGRRMQVQEREVLLMCDGKPAVYAHTVVPLQADAGDWPFFGSLGERSLGTTLFGDPLVRRGSLRFARLPPNHPLSLRAQAASGSACAVPLWARRCLFRRRNGVLLVTEVMLPALDDLILQENRLTPARYVGGQRYRTPNLAQAGAQKISIPGSRI